MMGKMRDILGLGNEDKNVYYPPKRDEIGKGYKSDEYK
jgi:hypothetical protein